MKYYLLLFATLFIAQISIAQSIQGKVYDPNTNEGLPFANVILYEDSIQIAGVSTDLDGNYSFEDIALGTYDIEAVYVGYANQRINNVELSEDVLKIDFEMEESEIVLHDLHYIPQLNIKLIQHDETLNQTYQTISGKIYDEKTNEGLPFAIVILLKDGISIMETSTDLDGNYTFEKLRPDEYDVETVYIAYSNSRITGISLKEKPIELDISMYQSSEIDIESVIIRCVDIPIIRMDETSTGEKWDASEIKRFPGF